ncbi:MAG: LamG-like jellyroll fold domain-containing protein [Pirellulaceae bacterium]
MQISPAASDAKSFRIEFSQDGGQTFSGAIDGTRKSLFGHTVPDEFLFDELIVANAIRLTITDNYFGEPGLLGGDAVGLNEVKFFARRLSVAEINGVTDDSVDVVGQYGTLDWSVDGTYVYTLDSTNPNVQRLGLGDTLTETFATLITDEADNVASALSITIRGVNDAPTAVDDNNFVYAGDVANVRSGEFDDVVRGIGPAAYWRLGEIDGTVVGNELSPGTPDGVIGDGITLGATSLDPTSANRSARFDGGGLIEIPDSAFLTGTSASKSFEILFKADDIQSRQVLFAQGNDAAGFNLYLDDGALYFGVWSGGALHHVHGLVRRDVTYHVVGVWNGSDAKLFINGLQADVSQVSFSQVSGHPGSLSIGGRTGGSRFHDGAVTSSAGDYFTGTIDEVALYNVALDADEVHLHHRALGVLRQRYRRRRQRLAASYVGAR